MKLMVVIQVVRKIMCFECIILMLLISLPIERQGLQGIWDRQERENER